MRILKINFCIFCDHDFYADTSKNHGTVEGYMQKNQVHWAPCFLDRLKSAPKKSHSNSANKAFCREIIFL